MFSLPTMWRAGMALVSGAMLACGPAAAEIPVTDTGPAVLSPAAEALRIDLPGELTDLGPAERAAILGFYAERDHAPFWTAPDTDRLAVLVATVSTAADHGLPVGRYGGPALTSALTGAVPATGEAAAMRAYLRWGGDLSAGLLTPSRIDAEINVTPDRPDAEELLDLLDTGPLVEVLAGLEPGTPEYRDLMAEKARLEALVGTGVWGEPVPGGPTLHPGDQSPRVPPLRARLARLGYAVPGDGEPAADAYDAGVEAAVRHFQRDSGLLDDGVLGARTLRALNAAPQDRLGQVLVNLERIRWADDDPGARHIVVNIPDYSVTMYEDGAEVYHSRAVVGVVAETETPEFSDVMTHMVVNPTWHIPDSIATRVYLPKLRSDPSVLARSNMSLFTRSGVKINPSLVDFSHYSASSFPFRIKQNPSAANALGRVKFMFPNRFSIYLHDTPARELFDRDGRAFSNGCVRLEEPLELAYLLLRDQVGDPAAAFDGWLVAQSERYIHLEAPVPVHIRYRTAWPEAGRITYRDDVYGRDAKALRALRDAGVTLSPAQG